MLGATPVLSSPTGGRNMAAWADCLILSDQKGSAFGPFQVSAHRLYVQDDGRQTGERRGRHCREE